ncbi:uncharacterized protein LOC144092928 isoform X2 [Stigmatopora argus]
MSGFRRYIGPDEQSVVFKGEVELPQIKEEEPEFPQQNMRNEKLPIKKEEEDLTCSPGETLKRQDDLGGASGGAEPTNTSMWPQIKEEDPEVPQQKMRDEQLPIKKEEEDATMSTGEPLKREDELEVASRGAEPLYGSSSTEGWQAEHLIAPLSESDDLLYADEDDEGLKKNPSGDKLCKCSQCGKTFETKSTLKTHMRSHPREKPYPCSICGSSCALGPSSRLPDASAITYN